MRNFGHTHCVTRNPTITNWRRFAPRKHAPRSKCDHVGTGGLLSALARRPAGTDDWQGASTATSLEPLTPPITGRATHTRVGPLCRDPPSAPVPHRNATRARLYVTTRMHPRMYPAQPARGRGSTGRFAGAPCLGCSAAHRFGSWLPARPSTWRETHARPVLSWPPSYARGGIPRVLATGPRGHVTQTKLTT